jgi:hypothetical protein
VVVLESAAPLVPCFVVYLNENPTSFCRPGEERALVLGHLTMDGCVNGRTSRHDGEFGWDALL